MKQMHQYFPEQVLKLFIQDCLLPSLENVVSASTLYKAWKEYCLAVGYGAGTKTHFGRMMGRRFQRTRRKGNPYYFCELREDIFEEEEE